MRDFQDRQVDAQLQTEWLIVFMVVAGIVTTIVFSVLICFVSVVLSMIMMTMMVDMTLPVDFFTETFFARLWLAIPATSLAVIGVTVYRCFELSEGGGRSIARQLGGTRLSAMSAEPGEKKILNVVEEMAIAAGITAPPVFVLQDDHSINAFAAGKEHKDYVIGVTQGAVDKLSRDQLQAVVAHEVSHIIHGDTRLNLKLIGMLSGVQVMARLAAHLLNMGTGRNRPRTVFGTGNPQGQAIALALGIAVYPVGAIGQFFARLAKLAVSRQREYLADASAVELTRNPAALCEALHVIAQEGSIVENSNAALASHLFFADVTSGWLDFLQTHPPLSERIMRLDPEGQVAVPAVELDEEATVDVAVAPEDADEMLREFALTANQNNSGY